MTVIKNIRMLKLEGRQRRLEQRTVQAGGGAGIVWLRFAGQILCGNIFKASAALLTFSKPSYREIPLIRNLKCFNSSQTLNKAG